MMLSKKVLVVFLCVVLLVSGCTGQDWMNLSESLSEHYKDMADRSTEAARKYDKERKEERMLQIQEEMLDIERRREFRESQPRSPGSLRLNPY